MKKLEISLCLVLVISILSTGFAFADEILDNDSPNVVLNGSWYTSTLVPDYYGNNYLWTYGGGSTASVEWVFQLPSEGNYQVSAWWSSPYQTRSPDAPFTIHHAAGTATVEVDQNSDGGQWNDLGTYYFSAGEARVVLSDDAQGNPVADAVQIIYVGGSETIVAAFSASPVSGFGPLNVDFVDQSIGNVETWLWDFGDGDTSTEQNPSHAYQNPGSYTVSLTVTGAGQESTETKSDYITVNSGDTVAYEFMWPIDEQDFFVFQAFGNQRMEQPGAYHAGTDFGVYRYDAEIRCIANGWVEKINTGFGYSIMIRHQLPDGETVYSWYNHLAESVANDFSIGEFVPIGTVIGIVGETGLTYSGLHLHLEIKKTSDYDDGYLFNLDNHYNAYEFILSRLNYDPNPPDQCDDGTFLDECSAESPFKCIEGGILVENSLVCGCDTGVPQTDATCSKTEDGIIVDNDDPGFESSGSWEATTEVMGFYGSDYLIAYAGGENSTATWTPDIPTTGNYEVYGWWRDWFSGDQFSDRATDAVLTINHAGAQDQVTVDFTDYYKEWKYLGTFLFEEGTNNSVVLSSTQYGDVVADAFRFVLESVPEAPVAEFSGSPISGTAPLTVNFTDASIGDVTTWSWDFGDGGTSTAQNPSHEYAAAGQYTVTLTATGPGGSDPETKSNYIDVSSGPVAPVAEFSGSPTTGTAPLTVDFTDASTGDVTTWSWNFGDGGTSTAQNPSHEYTTAGQYTVTLTATGPGGSDPETKSNYIDVSSTPVAPVAEFSGNPTSGTAPLTVNFTDASTGDVTTWSWNFGDGGTSTAQNPSHEYTTAGQYTVTLTATGPGGSDPETKSNYIDVSSSPVAPVAEFSGNPTSGTAPLTVNFTDASTGDVTTWSWDFGDGGTSTAQNPSHEYTTAGQYTVTLTATGPGGSDPETKTNYIDVTSTPVAPVADFSGSPTTITVDNFVSFTDESTDSPTSWEWIFEGGTPATSTDPNPTVNYNTVGTYDVTLTVSNAEGSDQEIKSGYITVVDTPITYCTSSGNSQVYEYIAQVEVGDLDNSSGASGYSDFTSITASLTAGESTSVTLTPGFTGISYNEYWRIWIDFNGDGDFEDADEEVFSGSGSAAVGGSFTVPASAFGTTRMRVSMNYEGYSDPCDSITYGEVEDYTVNIVAATPQPPVADFSGSPTTITVDNFVSFTDESTDSPTSWEWIFEGGTPATSTDPNPTVNYNTVGTYDVTLTVSNAEGSDQEIKSGYITVVDTPITYCTSSGNSQVYEYIAQVEVGDLDNSSGASGYSDFTSITASLTAGESTSVTLTPGFTGISYNEYWRIWIDFNGDGDFEDADEEVFSGSGSAAVGGSFTVPASAFGTTRMRVSMNYEGYSDPCDSITYGEVEDYTVYIE